MPKNGKQFRILNGSVISKDDGTYSANLVDTIEIELKQDVLSNIEFEYIDWVVNKEGVTENIYEQPDGGLSFSINLGTVVGLETTNGGKYTITANLIDTAEAEEGRGPVSSFDLFIDVIADGEPAPNVLYIPFVAQVTDVIDDQIKIKKSWNDFAGRIKFEREARTPTDSFSKYILSYKINDYRDLNAYLHLGDDNVTLITNAKTDSKIIEDYPYSGIYKLYQPLPDDIEIKDSVYIIKEILPQVTQTVRLVPYDQEDEDVLVLRVPDSVGVDSPITKRSTNFQTYDDLITGDTRLQKEIEDKYISGSQKPVVLNIDYSNYENFVNFSSAEKRLSNFKYKLQQIEGYTAESASFVSITNAQADTRIWDNKIRKVKTNFDGYENYLYNVSSSYESSSMGEFFDASWPKTGSGTYNDPFVPVSSSNTAFESWYGSMHGAHGQLYSGSLYDRQNQNRLVNLLPTHIREDTLNIQFFDFLDMIGQHFDELWVYIKGLVDITDRQNDLNKGFSKDLIYNLAKSLGWDVKDGKDLLELSRAGFGLKLSGNTYSTYTSGSSGFYKITDGVAASMAEGDMAKDITKRLISSMPYILKTKGTVGSLKAILNCYGIPSSILRVREYGGLQTGKHKTQFEIARKFTKALGFRSSQYITTTWVDDSSTSRKPDTIEFRFRSLSGSAEQILVQKESDWAIRLKDNDQADNYGTVAFQLSGSDGYKEISSSLLPVYDGEYHSVMLRKSKVDNNKFSYPGFETSSLFNPPFVTGTAALYNSGTGVEFGNMKIVSSSGVSRTGTNALRHENTGGPSGGYPIMSYNRLYENDPIYFPDLNASVVTVSEGETYEFSAYAKASGSTVDSLASLVLYELDTAGRVVNHTHDEPIYRNQPGLKGGISRLSLVGVNETEWKQVKAKKTINFPNTTGLGVRFENRKPNSTILWDDVSIRKVSLNTDDISDAFMYELFVKKYNAGVDRIVYSSTTNLVISSSTSQSYNAAWTGSGNLYIGGKSTTSFGDNVIKLSGSLMEFRLWTEPVEEQYFDIHVGNPKSYVGNTPSSSYYSLVRRFALNDDSALTGSSGGVSDTRANQTTTQTGSAHGFGGANLFESVDDKTKTIIPNYGPNRRMSSKIRIENNFLSGSGAILNRNTRYDASSNDFSPIDSPKLGIYFSPVDTVNEDIVNSFANLDFNQFLGDPRDNFSENYRDLSNIANQYFQKYTDNNDFWDYMHLIKYYDQSVFKQLRHVVPARAKLHMGTVIEGNIFERPKSPVQKNNPTFTQPYYTDEVNVTNFYAENEDSRSILTISTQYPNYTGNVDSTDTFKTPSLYNLSANDNFSDRNFYISSSVKYGGPNRVFSEPTGSIILNNRLSIHNQEYKYFYTSSTEYDLSDRKSLSKFDNLYNSRSLATTDLDPEYQYITALNRSFYEGVKNTRNSTIDGDDPIVIRVTSPTVAVPTDSTDSNLKIMDTE